MRLNEIGVKKMMPSVIAHLVRNSVVNHVSKVTRSRKEHVVINLSQLKKGGNLSLVLVLFQLINVQKESRFQSDQVIV